MTGKPGDVVVLTRDCHATTIPMGNPTALSAGDEVTIVQSLGGSVTVRTLVGALVRVNREDTDALGLDKPNELVAVAATAADAVAPTGPFSMEKVMAGLQSVYDPEIPVSIVELGLVYRCEEVLLPEGRRRISIDMSMTAPGCGMGDILKDDAAKVVALVPGVDEVEVTLVWDPPWDVSRMSEAARLQLGMF